ncbi:MAG: histidine phosphatase family protein [Gammaproteobacteria bacterium]
MKLYLVRHAQSENNVLWLGADNTDGRSSDPEITATGHQQAEQLAQHLAHPQGEPRQHPYNPVETTHFGLTHVYCSLMTRSILTARYIANACNLELQALPEIFEKYGIYEFDETGNRLGLPGPGLSYFANRFPGVNLPMGLTEDGWWDRPAETNGDFQSRVRSVIEDIRIRHARTDDCIAMVVHGDFMDQFINELMQVPRHEHNYANDWAANWTFHNTSLSRIDFIRGSHNIIYLNRIDHLPAELISC